MAVRRGRLERLRRGPTRRGGGGAAAAGATARSGGSSCRSRRRSGAARGGGASTARAAATAAPTACVGTSRGRSRRRPYSGRRPRPIRRPEALRCRPPTARTCPTPRARAGHGVDQRPTVAPAPVNQPATAPAAREPSDAAPSTAPPAARARLKRCESSAGAGASDGCCCPSLRAKASGLKAVSAAFDSTPGVAHDQRSWSFVPTFRRPSRNSPHWSKPSLLASASSMSRS